MCWWYGRWEWCLLNLICLPTCSYLGCAFNCNCKRCTHCLHRKLETYLPPQSDWRDMVNMLLRCDTCSIWPNKCDKEERLKLFISSEVREQKREISKMLWSDLRRTGTRWIGWQKRTTMHVCWSFSSNILPWIRSTRKSRSWSERTFGIPWRRSSRTCRRKPRCPAHRRSEDEKALAVAKFFVCKTCVVPGTIFLSSTKTGAHRNLWNHLMRIVPGWQTPNTHRSFFGWSKWDENCKDGRIDDGICWKTLSPSFPASLLFESSNTKTVHQTTAGEKQNIHIGNKREMCSGCSKKKH